MRRFLLYCLALALFVVALAMANDAANLWLIRSSSGNPAYKMERLWHGYEKDEIPILGSSRAQGNFVPSMISERCFDYGCDGMALPEVIFLLKRIAARTADSPVILNLDPWGFEGFEKPHFVGDYRLVPESGRVDFYGSLPGIRFHGALRMSLAAWLNSRKAVTEVVDCGARLLTRSRTQAEWKVINSKLKPWPFTQNTEGEHEFELALAALAPRKIIVAVGPCASRFMELYPSRRELGRYLGHLRLIDNVVVVNLFGSDIFTDDDFADPTHLNITGAKKFSAVLKDAVRPIVDVDCGRNRGNR